VHTPQEVAAAIAYLLSDLARGVNGTTHVLDFGGLARSTFPA
jgi:enoyl-[acyl-carrier-protein] reductase (NADH)